MYSRFGGVVAVDLATAVDTESSYTLLLLSIDFLRWTGDREGFISDIWDSSTGFGYLFQEVITGGGGGRTSRSIYLQVTLEFDIRLLVHE